jgi:hypothetical protein
MLGASTPRRTLFLECHRIALMSADAPVLLEVGARFPDVPTIGEFYPGYEVDI